MANRDSHGVIKEFHLELPFILCHPKPTKSKLQYLASNPISRSLSASSNTRTSRDLTQLARSRPSAFLRNMSSRRPGVATMMFPLWKQSYNIYRTRWISGTSVIPNTKFCIPPSKSHLKCQRREGRPPQWEEKAAPWGDRSGFQAEIKGRAQQTGS